MALLSAHRSHGALIMIHYKEIADIKDRIHTIESDLGYYDPIGPERDEMEAEILELQTDLARLEKEAEDYREGYEAGRQFHMDGVPMRDEWQGRFGMFSRGFDDAGADS